MLASLYGAIIYTTGHRRKETRASRLYGRYLDNWQSFGLGFDIVLERRCMQRLYRGDASIASLRVPIVKDFDI